MESDGGGGEGNVEREDRQQPEEELIGAELGRGPDPDRADDEHDLRQDQIREAELLAEDGAPLLDPSFLAPDLRAPLGAIARRVVRHALMDASWARKSAVVCSQRSRGPANDRWARAARYRP